MKSIISYIIEAYHHSKKSVVTFIGVLGFIWGAINMLISNEVSIYVFAIFVGIGLLFALCKFTYWYWRIYIGKMTVSLYRNHRITLIRNGYDTNMGLLLQDLQPEELKKFAFVMGIDKTGKLGISSNGGVVRDVLSYLSTNYEDDPVSQIQAQINEFMKEKANVDNNCQLTYGTCIEIKLNLKKKGYIDDSMNIPCNLILVANSRKQHPNNTSKKNSMDDDGKSNIIIPKVFEFLYDQKEYKEIMIGVMGTNGMGQTYQVVFSQIINQYARICFMKKPSTLENLYISIREADYSYSKMSLSHLEKYVRECADYYSTWGYEAEAC